MPSHYSFSIKVVLKREMTHYNFLVCAIMIFIHFCSNEKFVSHSLSNMGRTMSNMFYLVV